MIAYLNYAKSIAVSKKHAILLMLNIRKYCCKIKIKNKKSQQLLCTIKTKLKKLERTGDIGKEIRNQPASSKPVPSSNKW